MADAFRYVTDVSSHNVHVFNNMFSICNSISIWMTMPKFQIIFDLCVIVNILKDLINNIALISKKVKERGASQDQNNRKGSSHH